MTTPLSEAQLRAIKKYDAEKVDHIHLRLKKGKRGEIEKHIKATADTSINGFVSRAIDETIERDRKAAK